MLDSIDAIESYTEDVSERTFQDDSLIQDGVIRQFEILGEAAKQVSTETREQHDEIPWQDIAGMRDKLIHGYFGVDIDVVWKTVEEDVPHLKHLLGDIQFDA